jgi:SHS family lactate transporter-like MFS transporter
MSSSSESASRPGGTSGSRVAVVRGLTPDQRNAFIAALLGWTMDAFDYFLVVLVYADIAKDFGVSLARMALLTTATLLMRPIGAFLFGRWADSVGRRRPLIVDVCFYSTVGFLCAFAPNFTVLLVLRLLYGIGMGGEWGLGAALAMEKIPTEKRGFYSGVLQQGYALGYLLAAVAYLVMLPVFDSLGVTPWRGLFAFSLLPALVSLYIRSKVGESEAWERTRERVRQTNTRARDVFGNPVVLRRFAYLVLLMTAFNWMSHGTQDVYSNFLKKGEGFSQHSALYVTIIFNVGALIGGTLLGAWSQRIGRRRAIIIASVCGLLIVPLFSGAIGTSFAILAAGSFLMQFFVQGAWGVIPAHLTELSPDEIRGFYPGVTYQLGNCLAAFNLPIQEHFAASHSYTFALTATIVPVFLVVIVLALVGTEARDVQFGSSETAAVDPYGPDEPDAPAGARNRTQPSF